MPRRTPVRWCESAPPGLTEWCLSRLAAADKRRRAAITSKQSESSLETKLWWLICGPTSVQVIRPFLETSISSNWTLSRPCSPLRSHPKCARSTVIMACFSSSLSMSSLMFTSNAVNCSLSSSFATSWPDNVTCQTCNHRRSLRRRRSNSLWVYIISLGTQIHSQIDRCRPRNQVVVGLRMYPHHLDNGIPSRFIKVAVEQVQHMLNLVQVYRATTILIEEGECNTDRVIGR